MFPLHFQAGLKMCEFAYVYDTCDFSLINAYHPACVCTCLIIYVAYGFIEYEDRRDAEVIHNYPVHMFSLVLCMPLLLPIKTCVSNVYMYTSYS